MTLSSTLTAITGPSLTFNGFSKNQPIGTTINNINIEPTVNDKNILSNNYNQGFYLDSSNFITIYSSGFLKGSLNTFTLLQTFSNGSTASANYNFYYEEPITSAPTGTINSMTTSNYTYVSGIKVLSNTPTFTIQITANNMGKYFYSSPLIEYTFNNNNSLTTSTETNLTNSTGYSTIITTGTLVFNRNITLSNLSSTYSTSLSLSAILNNVFNKTTINSSINIITDGPSLNLISIIPNTVPLLILNNYIIGCRIWSAPNAASQNCPELKYSSTSYKDIIYNHLWNITENNNTNTYNSITIDKRTELLIYNGFFTTKGTNTNGYIDYSSYGNTINYSTISDTYRFATFAWNIPNKSTAYSTLSFTIYNLQSTSEITLVGGTLKINNTPLQIYYKFEDTNSSTFNKTTYNSVWINANSSSNIVNSDTFYDTNSSYGTLGGRTNSTYNNDATFSVFIPLIDNTPTTTYLYCRLCLPMSENIKFTYISAKIN